jgi:hypothetical protein
MKKCKLLLTCNLQGNKIGNKHEIRDCDHTMGTIFTAS